MGLCVGEACTRHVLTQSAVSSSWSCSGSPNVVVTRRSSGVATGNGRCAEEHGRLPVGRGRGGPVHRAAAAVCASHRRCRRRRPGGSMSGRHRRSAAAWISSLPRRTTSQLVTDHLHSPITRTLQDRWHETPYPCQARCNSQLLPSCLKLPPG